MSRIDFQLVNKRYASGLPLTIKEADLTIDHGEFCVFVGPSGCGKSTLLRMVAGLEDITDGELKIEGRRVNDLPPSQRGVAMVFQSYALYPHMTVKQNMAFGLKIAKVDKATLDKKVNEAAEILQLSHLLDRLPKALSGGQRQRVAIGRAIVQQPKVFLFDEPLSNLDAALRVQTRLEIAKLHEDIGTASMIYVTHDQVEAMTLADKIVLLHAGKLIDERGSVAQYGTPMDLYHRPASLFVAEFIGSPKMNLLSGSLVHAEAQHADIDVIGIRVRAAVDARRLPPGSPVSVGVRPEHAPVADTGEGASLPVIVTHVERLGDVSLLYVTAERAAKGPLTVRMEGSSRPDPGTRLTLRLRPQDLHVFSSEGVACPRTVDLPV